MSSTGMRGWAGVLGLVAAAGLAYGQEAKPVEAKPAGSTPVLQGPEVKDNSVPGQKRTFGDGNKERRAEKRPIGLPVIMRALEVVRGEKAGDNRLTDEQDTKLKAGFEEFQKQTREYFEKNHDEVASLRTKLSPEDRAKADQALGGGGRVLKVSKTGFKGKAPKDAKPSDTMTDDAGKTQGETPAVDPAESAKARARIVEIVAGRPKPEDAQAKAWSVLTDGQRTLVQAELTRIQKEGEKRPAKAVASLDLKSMSTEEIMTDTRVPQRLRDALKEMTPEKRDRVIQIIKDGGLAAYRTGRTKAGSAKPAPKLTDVKVPETN